MKTTIFKKSGLTAFAIAMSSTAVPAIHAPLLAQVQSANNILILSIGEGEQINLDQAISDVFIADPNVADVDVKSSRQIYLFGKGPGQTTFYATDAAGKTIYKRTIRVGNNINSIEQMLLLAMPNAKINVSSLNGITLLTGTVDQPQDAAEAERLVAAFSGEGVQVISRLKTATPLQVNLQVRIAEVSRSLAKSIGSNLTTRDNGGTSILGIQRGRNFANLNGLTRAQISNLPVVDASLQFGLPEGSLSLPFNPATNEFVTGGASFAASDVTGNDFIGAAGRLFGIDVAAAFDLSETAGLSTTLAQPNLTVVSGQTGEFLAGGSFPIPVSSGLGATTVEFRDFGIGLSYTPTVLSDGRISIRLRTEVSDISTQGAVVLNGFQVPAITTRTAETTVDLGSGESFMIAGLLSNTSNSTVDKLPGLGDVPILGSLFKSDSWQKNQTELMIVVTPYLVKPVNANEIKLPTDSFQAPNDLERIFLGKTSSGGDPKPRPGPTVAPGVPVAPAISTDTSGAKKPRRNADNKRKSKDATSPGFSFGG